jgi:hypothetical protein
MTVRRYTVLKDGIIPWTTPNGATGTKRVNAGEVIKGEEHVMKTYVDLRIMQPVATPVATNKKSKGTAEAPAE